MTESTDTRTRLLEVAERLFAEKGYAATSVREILRGTAVSSPTLYYHFGSKEELLVTLLRERFEAFFAEMGEATRQCTEPVEVFAAYAALALAGVAEQRTTVHFVFSVLYGSRPEAVESELRALHAAHQSLLLGALQRVSPETSPRRITFVAALFSGMVHGILLLLLRGYLERADEGLASAIAARAAAMLADDLPVPDMWVDAALSEVIGC